MLTPTADFYGRDSDWFLNPLQFSPDSPLQKSGHDFLVGIACADANRRTAHADFVWFEYRDL